MRRWPPTLVTLALALCRPAAAAPPELPARAVEDPCLRMCGERCAARALDPFYRALRRVERKEAGAVARVSHYGDSLTADDHIAGRARARLQQRFGDAGAGFLYPTARRRLGARALARGWTTFTIVHGGLRGARYGLGGSASVAVGGGAVATFATAARGSIGRRASRFEVYYLAQPRGAALELAVDGGPAVVVDTAAEEARSGFALVEAADAPHTFTVRAGRGRAQVFGVVVERAGPGVVWENLGLVSGSMRALGRADPDHLVEQLAHRRPDLVLVFFGANSARWTGASDRAIAAYENGFERMLGRIRAARPDGACLVMGPMDSEELVGGRLVTRPVLPRMVEAQRRAALARGCAFWDTFAWMGGPGSIARWRRRGMTARDLVHLPVPAAHAVADGLVDALLAGYEDYKARARER